MLFLFQQINHQYCCEKVYEKEYKYMIDDSKIVEVVSIDGRLIDSRYLVDI